MSHSLCRTYLVYVQLPVFRLLYSVQISLTILSPLVYGTSGFIVLDLSLSPKIRFLLLICPRTLGCDWSYTSNLPSRHSDFRSWNPRILYRIWNSLQLFLFLLYYLCSIPTLYKTVTYVSRVFPFLSLLKPLLRSKDHVHSTIHGHVTVFIL